MFAEAWLRCIRSVVLGVSKVPSDFSVFLSSVFPFE